MDLNASKSHQIIIQTRRYDMRIIVTSCNVQEVVNKSCEDNLLRNKHRHLQNNRLRI